MSEEISEIQTHSSSNILSSAPRNFVSSNFWLRIGGTLLGALSIFNLARKFLSVGLGPILSDILKFYQNFFYPIADAIVGGLNFLLQYVELSFPDIPKDLVVIHLVLGGAYYRGFITFIADLKLQGFRGQKLYRVVLLPFHLLFWPILLSISIIHTTLISRKVLPPNFPPHKTFRVAFINWSVQIIIVILTTLLLFALNYYSLNYISSN